MATVTEILGADVIRAGRAARAKGLSLCVRKGLYQVQRVVYTSTATIVTPLTPYMSIRACERFLVSADDYGAMSQVVE